MPCTHVTHARTHARTQAVQLSNHCRELVEDSVAVLVATEVPCMTAPMLVNDAAFAPFLELFPSRYSNMLVTGCYVAPILQLDSYDVVLLTITTFFFSDDKRFSGIASYYPIYQLP